MCWISRSLYFSWIFSITTSAALESPALRRVNPSRKSTNITPGPQIVFFFNHHSYGLLLRLPEHPAFPTPERARSSSLPWWHLVAKVVKQNSNSWSRWAKSTTLAPRKLLEVSRLKSLNHFFTDWCSSFNSLIGLFFNSAIRFMVKPPLILNLTTSLSFGLDVRRQNLNKKTVNRITV